MADSLFDNRYRYDYIYPRGRSGETLRAVDTQSNERPVVIKRPAPNDAPPIRAGQEVSILNERKALMRLAGHAVLTEFLGEGQFFVGGMPHQYIVMERAEGRIIADEVLELARNGERLPLLETLVIVDNLLDLLQNAHSKDIVYNDVDAKHLFWNRDTYSLKVIDWGNAIFLEGDEVTPQGISRQSDVYQVGELLYFILRGGARADVPRDAGPEFLQDFGEDAENVPASLQSIISKALHPNIRLRYQTIPDLRRALTQFRQPIERERDSVVNRVAERLRRDLSKNDLRGLLNALDPALKADPGSPSARQIYDETADRLRDLDVEADLDAVRISINGDNWERATDLLNELREKAGPRTAQLIDLLLDYSVLVLDADLPETPPVVAEAVGLIFGGKMTQAARILLVTEADAAGRGLQWLLAERISSRVPDIMLLRPNLYRLELALNAVEAEGKNIEEARDLLAEINHLLANLPGKEKINLAALRDSYRAVVDRLTNLNKLLSTVMVQQQLSNRKLPLSALDRALNAAMALADNMHIIGKQAASSPRDATVALDNSQAIDPMNPLWNGISQMLNALYDLLQSYQTYVPAADGSDVGKWLMDSHQDLAPMLERLFDEMLAQMVKGLETAGNAWMHYGDLILSGSRMEAVQALTQAGEAVSLVSPTLSGWFKQLRGIVDNTAYIERHALHGGLGRALADGWEAFDRGRLADAERLGQHAVEIARSRAEQTSAERLHDLANLMRDWIERGEINSAKRTENTLSRTEALYTPLEISIRDNFAGQMPTRETYLRAMNKGLVERYYAVSTAGLRLFFFNAILLGALEAHDNNLEDGRFWQDVAVRALGEHGAKHSATRTLDEFIERRRSINAGIKLLLQITHSRAVANLETIRRQLEENREAKLLSGGINSLRELELALRDWADGEFKAAGLKLDRAINHLAELEQTADAAVTPFRAWLVELQAAAAELHNNARQMRQLIERLPAEPQPLIRDVHRKQLEITERLLGAAHSATLRAWQETYESFLGVYTNRNIRRSARLEQFNELFRAMFIDRHPAYPLYRHWYDMTDNSPEFPAPPTDDPTPRLNLTEEAFMPETVTDDDDYPAETSLQALERPRRRIPLLPLIALPLVVIGIIVAEAFFGGGSTMDDPTSTAGPSVSALAVAIVTEAIETATPPSPDTDTPIPTATNTRAGRTVTIQIPAGANDETALSVTSTPPPDTQIPTETDTPEPTLTPEPTHTPTPEPPSDTPTATDTATNTHTPTPTLTATLPPDGLQGWQDLLALPARMASLPWNSEEFNLLADGSAWRLGVGQVTEQDEISIAFAPQILDLFYGNNAPGRINRSTTTISLATFLPTLLETDEVYFGMMLQSTTNPDTRAGLYVQVEGLNVINLFIRDSSEEEVFVRQLSVNSVLVTIRLERDAATGDVLVFLNERQVGDAIPFVPPDDPVQPVLFVKHGGVIVNVTEWRVGLR